MGNILLLYGLHRVSSKVVLDEEKINIINQFYVGCNLSPLLFSIFISNLGHELNSSGLGLQLQNMNISAIFFADDIVVLGRSAKALSDLMDISRTYFANHRLDISEKKSKVMAHDATTGTTTFTGSQQSSLTLEEVISFKYLGIPVCSKPYNLFKSFNDQVKKRSQSYLASVLSLVKTGPDRAELAFALWTCCALPSILYGSEVMPLTQATIAEVEKCQAQVGKFMLQLPRSSASVSASLDAGLKPVWAVIAERVLLYACDTMKKTGDYWARIAMNLNFESGTQSPYTRYLMKWKTKTNANLLSAKLIKKSVNEAAIRDVLEQQREHSTTTFAMNPPDPALKVMWFKPKTWVNDSCSTKIIARFRACNASLGNRGPTKDGRFYSLCPLCSADGIDALNNEVHMIIECPKMTQYRNSCGIASFIQAYRCSRPHLSALKLYALYFNDLSADSMEWKGTDLYHMYLGWHSLMKINI